MWYILSLENAPTSILLNILSTIFMNYDVYNYMDKNICENGTWADLCSLYIFEGKKNRRPLQFFQLFAKLWELAPFSDIVDQEFSKNWLKSGRRNLTLSKLMYFFINEINA